MRRQWPVGGTGVVPKGTDTARSFSVHSKLFVYWPDAGYQETDGLLQVKHVEEEDGPKIFVRRWCVV